MILRSLRSVKDRPSRALPRVAAFGYLFGVKLFEPDEEPYEEPYVKFRADRVGSICSSIIFNGVIVNNAREGRGQVRRLPEHMMVGPLPVV
jgi:hypothetical protein